MAFTPEEVARIRQKYLGYLEMNRIEAEELRSMTPEQGLRTLAFLMRSGRDFPPLDDDREREWVRDRWLRLKRGG